MLLLFSRPVFPWPQCTLLPLTLCSAVRLCRLYLFVSLLPCHAEYGFASTRPPSFCHEPYCPLSVSSTSTCAQCQTSPASGTLPMLRTAPLDFSVIPVSVSGRCLREWPYSCWYCRPDHCTVLVHPLRVSLSVCLCLVLIAGCDLD